MVFRKTVLHKSLTQKTVKKGLPNSKHEKQDYTLYSGAIWQSVPSLLSLCVFTKSSIVYSDEFRKAEGLSCGPVLVRAGFLSKPPSDFLGLRKNRKPPIVVSDFLNSAWFRKDISEFLLALFYSPLRIGRKKGTDNEIAKVSKVRVSLGYAWLFRHQSLFASFFVCLRVPYAIPTRSGNLNLKPNRTGKRALPS